MAVIRNDFNNAVWYRDGREEYFFLNKCPLDWQNCFGMDQ